MEHRIKRIVMKQLTKGRQKLFFLHNIMRVYKEINLRKILPYKQEMKLLVM